MLICICMLSISTPVVHAKDFIRTYTYKASDDDSKNSARAKAIEQVKLILLEEIGIYIQSYVEIDTATTNRDASSYLSHEIKTTTAGITKTQIQTERWNGSEYFLQAKIAIDVEDVIKKINDTIKARAKSKNVAELNKLLNQKDSEINTLSTELTAKKKALANQSAKVSSMRDQLALLRGKLNTQYEQERKIKNKLDQIKSRITNSTSKARNLSVGMTKNEIIRVAGKPASTANCMWSDYLSYGKYWAYLESGIFMKLIPVTKYEGACASDTYQRNNYSWIN